MPHDQSEIFNQGVGAHEGSNAGAREIPSSRWLEMSLLVIIMVIGIWLNISFLKNQDIWVDETTQLSGLTLDPIAIVPWLCGENPQRFGVPGDRMPPMSYWVGWLWARAFGLSEISMRMMGVTAVACAALLIAVAARNAWGQWAGVLAAAVFLYSPNTLVTSVEIRAYPLFILISAAAIYFCVRILKATPTVLLSDWGWLAGCCIAGIYTHFYGVVLAGSVICGMTVISLWQPELRKPLVVMAAVISFCSFGMVAFVMGASQMGGIGTEGLSVGSMARFIYRALIGHPSLAVYHTVTIFGMVAFVVMLALALFPKQTGGKIYWMLMIALLAGCLAAVVAKALIGKFDALSPSYNIWRLPMLSVLAGSVVAIRERWLRVGGIGATMVIIVAGALASGTILRNPTIFRHTPHREVVAMIKNNSVDTVVYDSAVGWAGAYFPLFYSEGCRLNQLLFKQSSSGLTDLFELPMMRESTLAQLPTRVVLIGTENQSMEDTVAMCRGNLGSVSFW